MSSKEIIKKVLSNNLTQSESASVMQDIFMGKVADQEIENFLTSLKLEVQMAEVMGNK